MEPIIYNYSIYVNTKECYSIEVMDPYRKLELKNLEHEAALSALRFFQAKHNHRGVAFFRQCEHEHFIPRLSILGINPSLIFQSKDGETRIEAEGKVESRNGDPLQIFSEILSAKKTRARSDLPFFQGGALGYVGYDAVRFIEPVLMQAKNLGLKTGKFDAEFIFFKNYLLFDHHGKKVTLLSETVSDEIAIAEALKSLAAEPSVNQIHHSTRPDVPELPLAAFRSSFSKKAFLAGVDRLKTEIKDGNIFQAVLSERFQHDFTGSPIDLFETLTQINPAPYQFFFSIEERFFLGASPEMLLKVDGNQVETHPIAGTRARGKTAEEEKKNEQQLLGCEKEKAEHLMLVDLARNDIGRVSTPGSVNVESFQKLRKFGGVMHLVSRVTGKLGPSVSSLDALRSCFPAGTLTGAPKIRAMSLLADIEPEARGFYGGAFLAASVSGDLDSCISIRSLSIEDKIVTIQAGAGIVADSSPENEYLEIEHKTRLSRKALASVLAKSRDAL